MSNFPQPGLCFSVWLRQACRPLWWHTIKAANLFAAVHAAAAGVNPVKVAPLIEGVQRAMFLKTLKIAATLVLLGAVVAFSVGWPVVWSAAAQSPKAEPVPAGEDAAKDQEKVQGAWQLVYAACRGGPLPAGEIANLKLVMKGEQHTLFE